MLRYAVLELLAKVRRLGRASLITRLRLDAARYDPPPERQPSQRGRPRLTGNRRPTLQAILDDPQTAWTTLRVDSWYGQGPRDVAVCTDAALWYHRGKPPVAIRWVLMRDPHKAFDPQALLSTDVDHLPEHILDWFIRGVN